MVIINSPVSAIHLCYAIDTYFPTTVKLYTSCKYCITWGLSQSGASVSDCSGLEQNFIQQPLVFSKFTMAMQVCTGILQNTSHCLDTSS